MLAHNKEGKLCLEDDDGVVEIDMSELVRMSESHSYQAESFGQEAPEDGLFTEGCFAMAEGVYTENSTFMLSALGHPPCETRTLARSIYGHIDFLGKGATTLVEDVSESPCSCPPTC